MELITKQRRLTRYGLACGYIERAESKDDEGFKSVVLEMRGSVLHVRVYVRITGERQQFSTNNLKESRKVYGKFKKQMEKMSGMDRATILANFKELVSLTDADKLQDVFDGWTYGRMILSPEEEIKTKL